MTDWHCRIPEAAAYSEDTTEPIHAVVDQGINQYDGFNRLVRTELIKATVKTAVEYTYDGDGLRVEKTVRRSDKGNTAEVTSYLYDRQHVILETRDSKDIRYVRGINYIARTDDADKLSYFMYNGHGDVVQTVSENGEIENQYDYDIFGNPTLTVENYLNSIRYSGEFYDTETGLYYLRARYYDPYIGRFISEDSYWGEDINPLSLNLYTYAHNDPIRYIDPSGHLPMVDDDTVYNPYTGNIINTRTGEKTSLKDRVEAERERRRAERAREIDEEERQQRAKQKAERERIENKLKEFRAALEDAVKAKEKSMAEKLKKQLNELESEIEKYSKIDGVGAEELKSKLIPELGTTLSRDTKGYNVYVDLMQYKLNKLGYTDARGNELAEDGKFGKNTEYAVNKFKETNKLWNHDQYKGKAGQTTYDMLFSGKAKRAPERASEQDKALPPPKKEEIHVYTGAWDQKQAILDGDSGNNNNNTEAQVPDGEDLLGTDNNGKIELPFDYITDHIPLDVDNDAIPKDANGKPIYTRRPGVEIDAETITIHSTGNPTSVSSGERKWLTNPSNKRTASFHIVVDEKQAIEVIPLNEKAIHASSKKGNETSIGIEITHSGDREKTLRNTILLTAKLLDERGWDTSHLRTHNDWSGKNCPSILIDPKQREAEQHTWEWFVNEVDKLLQ